MAHDWGRPPPTEPTFAVRTWRYNSLYCRILYSKSETWAWSHVQRFAMASRCSPQANFAASVKLQEHVHTSRYGVCFSEPEHASIASAAAEHTVSFITWHLTQSYVKLHLARFRYISQINQSTRTHFSRGSTTGCDRSATIFCWRCNLIMPHLTWEFVQPEFSNYACSHTQSFHVPGWNNSRLRSERVNN